MLRLNRAVHANRPDVDLAIRDGRVRETLAVGRENIATSQPADDFARIVACNDSEAAYVFIHDVVGGFAKRVVFEDDGRRSSENLAERRGFR